MRLPIALLVVVAIAAARCPAEEAVRAEAAPGETVAGSQHGSIQDAVKKGVAFLVKTQNADGSWGTGTETRGLEIYSMVPGSHDAFRVATTALAVMALREAGEKDAHAKGLKYLLTQEAQAKRDAGPLLYNVWAHKYTLQALSIEMGHDTDPKIREAATWNLDRLVRYETHLGGWNYYDFHAQTQKPSMEATSFGTAAGLVALWQARKAGIDVPQKLIDRGLHRLEEMRLPNGAYLYGGDHRYYPRHYANMVRGSVGRTQSGNFALWLWESEKVDEAKVREGLDMFFKEHDYIAMGRKRPYPHESWYATAPYYYYFGHYYAGLLLEKLGDEGKTKYGRQLAATILPFQEPDGSWWDYAMWDYHKPYGTAFSIMTLLRCEPTGAREEAKP